MADRGLELALKITADAKAAVSAMGGLIGAVQDAKLELAAATREAAKLRQQAALDPSKAEAYKIAAQRVEELKYRIQLLNSELKQQLPDPTRPLREGAAKTTDYIQQLKSEIGGLLTVGAIVQFARSSVQEFAKAESAIRGLEAVANASGAGIGNALKKAEELAADGLIGVSDASKALQNLLSRGYNLDQAVATITRLKDAAAFNRQASLSMADAVVSATEGLKNENSILVDNAGVTKNVAKMWEEYAKQRGITTGEMTQAMKIEAEYQGILAETAAQTGNAQKALAGFQGQMAQADQASLKFEQSLGEGLAPVMAGVAQGGTNLIENFFKPLVFLAQAAGVRMAQVGLAFGSIWDAITRRDFSQIKETVRVQGELAEKEIEDIARRLDGSSLRQTDSLTGAADPAKAKEVADKLKADAAAAAEAQKEMAKATKTAIEAQIKDYQALANAARDAWQQSIDAQKDYIAQARALEAEATAKPKDSSVEGQASALLDVIYAQEKLNRLQSQSAPLEDVQAQAKLVRDLAGGLDDQVRAQEAVNQSKLTEAKALRAAAADEGARQEGLREQWRQSEQIVKDLKTALDSIGEQHDINIESEQAKTVLAEITAKLAAIQDKTVVVTVLKQEVDTTSGSSGVSGEYAAGGPIFGPGGPRDDRVLAMLSNGEHVLTAAEVAAAGGHAAVYRLRQSLLAGLLPRFAAGGMVGAASRLSEASSAPAFPHLGRIDFSLGGASYPVYAEPDTAAALRQAARKFGARP